MERLSVIQHEETDHGSITPSKEIDFFISYASEDINEANFIAQTFLDCGVDQENLWFDKQQLKVGNDYAAIIEQSIYKAKRFVAVLSKNTLTRDARWFKREWTFAEERNKDYFNEGYITPVIVDDSDINNGFPALFRNVHCINSSDPDFKLMIKDLVREIRR